MKNLPGQRFASLAVLVVLALGTATLAHEDVENRIVLKRMHLMADTKAAIDVLDAMMGGRVRFDSKSARQARKVLIRNTGAISARFRRQQTDPRSHARPDIWTDWPAFKARARTANNAAIRLNARSLEKLRMTLPKLVLACINCHNVYRFDPD